jgi:hypothetical protein
MIGFGRTWIARAGALGLVALAGSGCATPLVGEACAPGYHVSGGDCVPDARGGTPTESTGAGGSAACGPGLADCGGCVDLGTDAANCGACGNACVGAPCIAGACAPGVVAPGAVGHAVVLGFDLGAVAPGDPPAELLGNAVFLASHHPVRILDYRELTTWNSSAVTNTVDLIADEAVAKGRTVTTTVAPDWSSIPTMLASGDYDVLFVHSLDHAPSTELATIGAAWAPAIPSFVLHGGVVVVLATSGAGAPMGDLLTSSTLLPTSAVVDASASPLAVPGTADALGLGLSPTLAPIVGAASLVTSATPSPSLAFVVTAGGAPVAVHRTWY